MKSRASVRSIQSSKTIKSVANERPFVRVAQTLGPELEEYVGAHSKVAMDADSVARRLREVSDILKDRPLLAPQPWTVEQAMLRATETVTVVRLDHLRRLLKWYLACLDDIGKDLVQFATLQWDAAQGESRLLGVRPDLLIDDIDEAVKYKRGD